MLRSANRLAVVSRSYSSNSAVEKTKSFKEANQKLLDLLHSNQTAEAAKKFLQVYQPNQAHRIDYFVYKDLFRQVFNENRKGNSNVSSQIALKDLFNKYLEGKVAKGWMCSFAILDDIHKGHPEKGLESWVKYLESFGSTKLASQNVNREAGWSALAAYIVNCHQEGVELDTKVALRLVPMKNLPLDVDILSLYGIKSLPKETLRAVLDGCKKIRLASMDYNSTEFLLSLPTEARQELEIKYNEVKEKAAQTGVQISEVTYAHFMTCFVENSLVQKAFEIWNEMQQELKPTIVGFNALLRAGSQSRQDSQLLVDKIWDEMVNSSGVEPNSESFGILMEFYFRRHQYQKAMDLYRGVESGAIKNANVTLRIFNIVINGVLRNGDVATAEELLKQGQEKGYAINVVTYNTFIRTYIELKQYEKIEPLIADMKTQGIDPSVSTYTNLIDATFKVARQNSTVPNEKVIEALFDEMASKGLRPNHITMTSLISGLVKSAQDIEAARMVFEKLIQQRIQPNSRTFATIIDGEITLGELDRALNYFDRMKRYKLPKSTSIYNQLINGFVKRGRLEEAFDLFNGLVNDKRTDPNKFSYYFMLQACENRSNGKIAQQVIDQMASHRYDFDLGVRLPGLLKRLNGSNGVVVPEALLEKAEQKLAAMT